jgi:hypothetical protein
VSSLIYRVIIEYGYRKKSSARAYKYKKIDTFVLTNDIDIIKKNQELINKICIETKLKKSELDITFKNIYIEGQYGQTNY